MKFHICRIRKGEPRKIEAAVTVATVLDIAIVPVFLRFWVTDSKDEVDSSECRRSE